MTFNYRRPLQLAALSSALVGGALFAVPATSFAGPGPAYVPTGAECSLAESQTPGNNQGYGLQDQLGYLFDVYGYGGDNEYGALDDSTSVSPPAAVTADDAYDDWGSLFVGADPTSLTTYDDSNELGCSQEDAGRQLVMAKVSIDGLDVQRRIFVSGTTGSGVRLLDSVSNPTNAPITTDVYVGDITSQDNGSFGSDGATRIESTTNGDTTIDPTDLWASTTDGNTTGSDPAIASVWGGAGARLAASDVRFGAAGSVPSIDDPSHTIQKDQAGWGWQNVTIPAGKTVSFASWSLLRVAADGNEVTQGPLATEAAQTLESDGPSRWYEGLTQDQIASVQNWASPTASVSIAPVASATTTDDTTLSASDVVDGAGVSQCTDGDLTWDFGDGGTATGTTVTHRFAAGTANVTLHLAAACGGTASATKTFSVVAPTPIPTPTPTPAPTATPAPIAAPAPTATPAPAPAKVAQCVSTRVFTAHFRVPGGRVLKSVTTQLDGATPVKYSGKTRAVKVDLRGKTAGTSVFVITAKTSTGKTLKATRTYHPCTSTQPDDLSSLRLS